MTIIDLQRGDLLVLDSRAGGAVEVLFGRLRWAGPGGDGGPCAGSGEQIRLAAGGRVSAEALGFVRLLVPAAVRSLRPAAGAASGGTTGRRPALSQPTRPGATMRSLYLLAAAALLGACATPTVVETRKGGDTILGCDQLRYELAEADRFEKEARAERRVTGTNVAAAVFFWPALLATYSNSDQAITAARERKAHLYRLADARNCGV